MFSVLENTGINWRKPHLYCL